VNEMGDDVTIAGTVVKGGSQKTGQTQTRLANFF